MRKIYYAVFDTELGGVLESSTGVRRAKTIKLDRPMIGIGRIVRTDQVFDSAELARAAYRSALISRATELESEAARLRARATKDVTATEVDSEL